MSSDFVNEWMSKIKAGREYQKKYSSQPNWDKYRRMYRGDFDANILPVNRIFSYGRTLIPRVFFRSPRVCVTATRPDLVWHARVVEAIDNMLIKETMLKETLKMAILDAFLCGTGPIKIGYDSEFGFLPEQIVTESGETITQEHEHKEELIEYSTRIKPGFPWALRVRPDDVIVPWGSCDKHNLPWIAHYIVRPLEDVKGDPKYRNTDDIKGTRMPNREGVDVNPSFRPEAIADKDVPYAELWEIRDLKTRSVYVICENKLLLAAEDVTQVTGLPWEFLIFNEDPEHFWGISDVKILHPQQYELNEVRTQISQHRKISLMKFLYRRGAIKEEELEKFLSGMTGPAVAIEDDVENLQNAIVQLTPHIPQELYNEYLTILNDMRETLGFTSNQLGEFSPYHNKSATESAIVEQGFSMRVDERQDIVADVLLNIIRKWNQMIFQFWNEDRVIQIVSPQGQPFWVRYTGDQLAGEYMLHIDPESGIPINRALRYTLAKELFMALNGDPLIDQMLLRQIFLSNFAAIEPMAQMLVQPQKVEGVDDMAQIRQPHPMFSRSSGPGSSPNRPIPFEQLPSVVGK